MQWSTGTPGREGLAGWSMQGAWHAGDICDELTGPQLWCPLQAWMEHRYLLSSEDLLQRPRWAAAVRACAGAAALLPRRLRASLIMPGNQARLSVMACLFG